MSALVKAAADVLDTDRPATLPQKGQINTVKLSEVADVRTGLAKNSARSHRETELHPYLRVANVQDGYLDLSDVKQIAVPRGALARFALEKGDVLLTEGGDFDKLGRGAVWHGDITPCLHQNHVFAVRCDKRYLLPEYLSLYCGSSFGKRYFLSCSKQTTNLASINSSQLKAMPLLLPPLPLQSRISNAVAVWERALETSAQLLAAKQRRKIAVAATLFAKTDAPLGFIGDLAELNPRQSGPDVLRMIAFVGMEDVTEGAELHRWRMIDRPSKASGYTPFQNGDILVAKITPCFENGKGALIADLPSEIGLGSTEFHVLRPKRALDVDFLHQVTKLPRFRKAGSLQMVGSAGQQRIPAEFIRDFRITVPAEKERDRIGSILRLLDDEIQTEQIRLAKLAAQRKALVERLLADADITASESGTAT